MDDRWTDGQAPLTSAKKAVVVILWLSKTLLSVGTRFLTIRGRRGPACRAMALGGETRVTGGLLHWGYWWPLHPRGASRTPVGPSAPGSVGRWHPAPCHGAATTSSSKVPPPPVPWEGTSHQQSRGLPALPIFTPCTPCLQNQPLPPGLRSRGPWPGVVPSRLG